MEINISAETKTLRYLYLEGNPFRKSHKISVLLFRIWNLMEIYVYEDRNSLYHLILAGPNSGVEIIF